MIYLQLFLNFLMIGTVSFGGGYGIAKKPLHFLCGLRECANYRTAYKNMIILFARLFACEKRRKLRKAEKDYVASNIGRYIKNLSANAQ